MRTATVAHALLRAVAGQLITARRAREIERLVIRAATRELGGLHAAPTAADLGRFSPAELRRLGLGERRGAALVRLCRAARPRGAEGRSRPTSPPSGSSASAASARGRSASSASQGLGRYERGLARDLGLVKLASALWGRRVEAEETDVLLDPVRGVGRARERVPAGGI